MRTETIEIFKFDELDEAGQERVLGKWREVGVDNHWSGENKDTLEAFEKLFPVTVKNWQYGSYGGDYIHFKMDYMDYDEVLEFTGIRLLKWLVNNYWDSLFTPKYMYYCFHNNTKAISTHSRHRHSKVFFSSYNCPLTGYCVDNDILDPLYKFIKNPCKHTTLEDLMHDCLNSWVSSCNADCEYQNSDEAIKETIEANDYEFYANGDMA